MLRSLEVRNLGIIDQVALNLPPGFVVLTGETGAGKSLLVQSLQLLAGERADAEQVRGGCDRLLVEGVFDTPGDPVALGVLSELGVGVADALLIRREVTAAGRSRAWVNDVSVTVGALQRLAPCLLAIHGQHEQRGLTDPATHIALVDMAGGLLPQRDAVGAAFAAWQFLRDRLASQRAALATRRDRLDLIAFQVREIDDARVKSQEIEALREERSILQNAERIGELLGQARSALSGEAGAVALARAARAVRDLVDLGVAVSEAAEELEQAVLLAEDAERLLVARADRVRHDPQRLEAAEQRLALLERLARKYGGSIDGVLEHRRRLASESEELAGVEDDIARLEAEDQRLAGVFLALAVELSRARAVAARDLAARVVGVLAQLGMGDARLELMLAFREGSSDGLELEGVRVEADADGIDVGEFALSANPGEAPRPLAKIASGGELSRLHLAMRTVLRDTHAERDRLSLLFDEVDAGIGGRVADALGELLAGLGQRDQVLVVTHLPQVARRASTHFVVSKHTGQRTVTRVQQVEGDERVEELARMLGGVDTAARQHARALLRPPR
jgi:DNA repair protein RecN (Recombination protein N)